MKKNDVNPFISFYGQHNVSPVHQNIENLKGHMMRREKLYRKLGLAPVSFKGKTILEIGPGGGYNSIVFFKWGANMDFVEPNPKGQEEIPVQLANQGISEESWTLFKDKIENYPTNKTYDILIAEGFIPGISNRGEVIERIRSLVNPGGVAVVTCIDDISFFFENLKRLIAAKLIIGIKDFSEKVKVLSLAFEPHLKKLKNSTRPVEDYVIDQFLNPALYCELFSIADCIKEFGEEFVLLGSTPQMFTDHSWYKDLDYKLCDSLLKQFASRRHMLIMTDMEETERDADANDQLFQAVNELRIFSSHFEDNPTIENLNRTVELIRRVRNLVADLDRRIIKAIDEAIDLMTDNKLNPEKVGNAEYFGSAFGRGQQYVSMVKKFTV